MLPASTEQLEGTVFDTNLVVVGNVLAAPEWRRIASTGALVANFRIASNARRFDRENDCWVDGNNLRLRVTAWRRLAEGVASSITTGDPVIVYGRVYTRDWTDDKGNHRTSYEMEAFAIGHDLSRGRGKFYRTGKGDTSTVSDEAEEGFVGGDMSVPLTAEEAPVGYGDGVPEAEEPTFADVVAVPESEEELALEVERLAAAQPPVTATRRSRRAPKREPVPA